MLYDNIDQLIKESMLKHDSLRTKVLRLIKTQFMNAMTAKGAGEMTEQKEIQILTKMVKLREDSAQQYREADRIDLAEIEESEIAVIKEFLPEEVSEDKVIEAINEEIAIHGTDKKVMGLIIKSVKSRYASFDGGRLASLVKERLV